MNEIDVNPFIFFGYRDGYDEKHLDIIQSRISARIYGTMDYNCEMEKEWIANREMSEFFCEHILKIERSQHIEMTSWVDIFFSLSQSVGDWFRMCVCDV